MKNNRGIHIILPPPFWLKMPPLSLIYLENYLKNKDINVKIIDLNNIVFKNLGITAGQWLKLDPDFENNLFSIIKKDYPYILNDLYKQIAPSDFLGFSLFKRNLPFTKQLIQAINTLYPNKQIILGGPETLLLNKSSIDNNDYFWVIGEGELPLYQIVTGQTQKNYSFQEIDDLDTLPFLDFSSLRLANYSNYLPLFSSRGCMHKCNFCSEKLLYKKFRYHSPKYMVEQIKYLIKKYNFNYFVFCDSMINYKLSWLNDFCWQIIKDNLKIQWEAQIRIQDNLPLELAKLMKTSGCYNLFIGLESGSDNTLHKMNKGISTASALSFFKNLTLAGLHFELSLIIGYPGEENKDFLDTIDFIVKNKQFIPKIAQVNPFIDYLNTMPDQKFPTPTAIKNVETLINIFQREKIKYTKGFINNLI